MELMNKIYRIRKAKAKNIFCAFLFILCVLLCIYYWISSSKPRLFQYQGDVSFPVVDILSEQSQSVTRDGMHQPDEDYDFDGNLVVLYNRVPKTGSTSFVNIAYDLCKLNRFHVLHINVTANMHVLSVPNQIAFVRNVSNWRDMKPAFYHGHMAFLDFAKYQVAHKPIYINIVRKPLDRLVSYYYFLRYGDNYRPSLVRRKAGNKITFDDCVKLQQPDCDPKVMWLQVPFFCGHSAECWEPGSEWALKEAKHNLVHEYFLVGVTEQMEEFVDLLEKSLPRIFKGFGEHYHNSNKSHLRQTSWKVAPNESTVDTIMKTKVWQMENELYEFALAQFEFSKHRLTIPDKNVLQKFMYEKIRPK